VTRFSFHAQRWAAAFLKVTDKNAEEAFLCLKELAEPIKAISGLFYGYGASAEFEILLREIADDTAGNEYAIRFICLLIEKKCLRHIDLVFTEIEKMLNKRNNILEFTIETAAPMKTGFKNEITQIIREKTGSADVKIKTCVRPELLGGYLLRTNGFYIDATLKDQADKMKKRLISGVKLRGGADAKL